MNTDAAGPDDESAHAGSTASARLTISVVIETCTAEPETDTRLRDVLTGLSGQTAAAQILEVIVVCDEGKPWLDAELRGADEKIRVLKVSSGTYFSMKFEGSVAARGDIIALIDSDCVPAPDWAASLLETIAGGADVSAGRTRYPVSARFATAFNVFNFGHLCWNESGTTNGFIVNNVAFRRERLLEYGFDLRIGRTGAGNLLAHQLMHDGYSIRLAPNQSVTHNDYGLHDHLMDRVRSGFEAATVARIDANGLVPESKFRKLGALSPFVLFLRRTMFDFKTITTRRTEFAIDYYQVPLICIASVFIRSIEVGSGLITIVFPDYFKRRYGW